MLRPTAVFEFTFFVTLIMCFVINNETVSWFGLITLGFLAVFVIFSRIRNRVKVICVVLAAMFVGTTFFYFVNRLYVKPVSNITAYNLNITAKVIDIPESDADGTTYLFESETNINGQPEKIRFSSRFRDAAECLPLDVVDCNVNLMPLDENSRFANLSKGIFLKGEVNEIYSISAGTSTAFSDILLKIRLRFMKEIEKYIGGDSAGIIEAVTVGNKSNISYPTMGNLSVSGTSHLVAVSGLHVSTVALLITSVLAILKIRKRLARILSVLLVWVFVFSVGCPLSGVRSGLMFTIFCLMDLLFLPTDTLTSLAVAVIAVCIVSPFSCTDYGFICSVSATFGVIFFTPVIESSVLKRLPIFITDNVLIKGIVSTLCSSLGASICLVPCSIFIFGRIALFGMLLNIIAIPVIGQALLFAILGNFLSFLPVISEPVMVIAGIFAKIISVLARWFSKIPFASVQITDNTYTIWLVICLAVIVSGFLISIFFKNKKAVYKTVSVICIAGLVISVTFETVSHFGEARIFVSSNESCFFVTVESYGQKAAFFLSDGHNSAAEGTVKSTLYRHCNSNVNFVVLGNEEDIAFSAVAEIYDKFNPERFYTQTEKQCKTYSAFIHSNNFYPFNNDFGMMNVSCHPDKHRFLITVNGYKILIQSSKYADTGGESFNAVICPVQCAEDYANANLPVVVPVSKSTKLNSHLPDIHPSSYENNVEIRVDSDGNATFF